MRVSNKSVPLSYSSSFGRVTSTFSVYRGGGSEANGGVLSKIINHKIINHNMALKIADKEFTSRLFTGTGKFASNQLMEDAILASESQLVTVALKRVNMDGKDDDILAHLKAPHIT